MKPRAEKLMVSFLHTLLDVAHEASKQAVNEATRLAHVELKKRKEKAKKDIEKWAKGKK
jgi:hypothetical protein